MPGEEAKSVALLLDDSQNLYQQLQAREALTAAAGIESEMGVSERVRATGAWRGSAGALRRRGHAPSLLRTFSLRRSVSGSADVIDLGGTVVADLSAVWVRGRDMKPEHLADLWINGVYSHSTDVAKRRELEARCRSS